MDRNQNPKASESTISSQDVQLIWGTNDDEDHCRAALVEESHDAQISQDLVEDTLWVKDFQEKNTQNPKIFEEFENCKLPEIELDFLTRSIMFASHTDWNVIFQFVVDFIQQNEITSGNFKADRTAATIRGGLFHESRFVEYAIKLFTHRGHLGLSLDVLDGFSPAVQDFWKQLQSAFKESHFTEEDSDDESDSDYDSDMDFLDSDCEDEFTLDLEQAKYLKLDEYPELVEQMIHDLSNPNFMQQTLLLLCWNCQKPQNFKAVAGKNQAQQLFDTIIACMITTATDFCLPIARCASLLVSQLVESHDIKISEDQFNVLVQTLVQWTISNQQSEEKEKLTTSEEIASILSSQMSKMAPLAANWKDTLERVYTEAPYDCVRTNLHQVIRAY